MQRKPNNIDLLVSGSGAFPTSGGLPARQQRLSRPALPAALLNPLAAERERKRERMQEHLVKKLQEMGEKGLSWADKHWTECQNALRTANAGLKALRAQQEELAAATKSHEDALQEVGRVKAVGESLRQRNAASRAALLPDDIYQQVFAFLVAGDVLLTAAQVCRRWQECTTSPVVWRSVRISMLDGDDPPPATAAGEEDCDNKTTVVLRLRRLLDAHTEYRRAIEHVRAMDWRDIHEMRAYSMPPACIVDLMQALLLFLTKSTTLPAHNPWQEGRRMMADIHFFNRLIEFSHEGHALPQAVSQRIDAVLSLQSLTPENMRRVSIAGLALLVWVRAAKRLNDVWPRTANRVARLYPTRPELERAEKHLQSLAYHLRSKSTSTESYREHVDQLLARVASTFAEIPEPDTPRASSI
eukprot:TRINITY_DN41919_c0_g1_i1.p1 TRINITY_DN41919_c0_g1~~TRINITY_DN41919_c0_g1_i1.p1  ORF type:complete len:422 (+),score=70.44 TRINITY_DN41919_c0_g1_i1:25-1266(+)